MPELEKPLKKIVENALVEDCARRDITTIRLSKGFKNKKATAQIIAKEEFLLCGLPLSEYSFKLLDKNAKFKHFLNDGEKTSPNAPLLEIKASTSAILSAERVALNLLQLSSAVATKTALFVKAVHGTNAEIYDTRKTLPLLRPLQRYAVRIGGGKNHRLNLASAILLKDNHWQLLRKKFNHPQTLFSNAYKLLGKKAKSSEVEVSNIAEMEYSINAGFRFILLDNFSLEELKDAVTIARKLERSLGEKIILEASGGINLQTVRPVAETGVDRISIGTLTRDITTPDISLNILNT